MKKCAKCEKTVYPVEEFKCLDKIWHKTCFKCAECGMILNMKSYKGFDKQPYCNAHCPQAKATIVADTPEARRLAENTKIQSNIQYHADFEKQKGKLTQVADDPETLRLRSASKIQSQAAYHGEYERKKQMEEIRSRTDDPPAPMPVAVLPTKQTAQPNNLIQNNVKQSSQQQNISAASVGHSLHQNVPSHPSSQYQHVPTQPMYHSQQRNIQDSIKNSPTKIIPNSGYYDQQQPLSRPQMPTSSMSATARLYPNQVPPVPVQQQYQQQQQTHQQQQQLQQHLQQQYNAQMHQQQQIRQQQANYYHPGAQQSLHNAQQSSLKQMSSPAHHPHSPHHLPQQVQSLHHSHQASMYQPPPQAQQMNISTSNMPQHTNLGRCFRAIYDYTAQDVDEVTFVDGDIIINCQAIDDGWMTGTVQRTGKTGMLPSNYVETV